LIAAPALRNARPWLLLVLLGMFALPALAIAQDQGTEVMVERRVFDIARQLRCPICVSESVAASSSQIALTMRQEIQELVLAGRTDAEILEHFQAAYGDWIRLEPPKRGLHLLVWLLPFVVALAGLVMLIGFIRRSTRAGNEEVQVDEEDMARLRRELSSGDGRP
jgi:cytochrome c-type biogenesis protein CcmH